MHDLKEQAAKVQESLMVLLGMRLGSCNKGNFGAHELWHTLGATNYAWALI